MLTPKFAIYRTVDSQCLYHPRSNKHTAYYFFSLPWKQHTIQTIVRIWFGSLIMQNILSKEAKVCILSKSKEAGEKKGTMDTRLQLSRIYFQCRRLNPTPPCEIQSYHLSPKIKETVHPHIEAKFTYRWPPRLCIGGSLSLHSFSNVQF